MSVVWLCSCEGGNAEGCTTVVDKSTSADQLLTWMQALWLIQLSLIQLLLLSESQPEACSSPDADDFWLAKIVFGLQNFKSTNQHVNGIQRSQFWVGYQSYLSLLTAYNNNFNGIKIKGIYRKKSMLHMNSCCLQNCLLSRPTFLMQPWLYLSCLLERFLRQPISLKCQQPAQWCCRRSPGWSVCSMFPRHLHRTERRTQTQMRGSKLWKCNFAMCFLTSEL